MRLLAVGVPFAAYLLLQSGAAALAQSASSEPMFTKAPPITPPVEYSTAASQLPASWGDVTTSLTGLGITNGFSDRATAEVAANWYSQNLGLHVDTGRDWREENANFIIAGLSYAITPNIRPEFLYGTSSENAGIQPRTYLRGEIQFTTPAIPGQTGIVATPAVSFREYRNGVQEVDPEFDVAFYHPALPDNTYFVTEFTGTANFVQSISAVGYEIAGGETYVMPYWGTLGAEVFGGRMVYDNTLCVTLCSVQNQFFGIRPLASFYLDHNPALELFFRGEIATTNFYNIYGGTIGFKRSF
jgi:hypothetical protein